MFYDWEKTLSYDADVTMVVGARGIGKTYGLRKQFIRDWLKDGSRFVEATRFKNELSGVSDGYFNRVGKEFPELAFKTDARYAYVSKDKDKDKRIWHIIGYFVALSSEQSYKKRTFDKVRRLVLDEAVLDRTDRYHTYLPNEYQKLANMIDTVSRERADTECLRPRAYLLGNALDLANPYFAAYRIPTKMQFGYSWHKGKTCLLHYVQDAEYATEKVAGTVAGRMLAGTEAGDVAAGNLFIRDTEEFVKPKPRSAEYRFGIVLNGRRFGIWLDSNEGLYHVTEKTPNQKGKPVYSLTASDSSVNYIAARRAEPAIKTFAELWYMGLVRYETVQVKTDFKEVLALFGIR